MPPTTGTRTSTRQGRATVRPTNYYARTFAGRLAASGMEQTPEASNSAPGFLPALTHFTGAVDAFPKEIIKHFSMFKEVEAKLHDPEHMLKELLDDIAQQPVATRAEVSTGEHSVAGVENGSSKLENLSREEQAAMRKRQLFFRLRMLIANMLPTLDEKLVVLQGAKATKDKGLMRMHHSHSQLDGEISDEARYGSLTHWAYADKEEKKKGGQSHERQRREVAAANNLAAAAQHVHDVDSIAAKSEARREAMHANKRSRHHQVDSDFDDRPAKKTQKRKPMPVEAAAPDNRNIGLGISSNGTGPHGKRKKTEKALAAAAAAAAPAAPPMERSLSSALKAASNGARGGSSPRGTPAPENGAAKRKPRAAPVPAQRKNPIPPYSPPTAASPLAANFAINKAIAGASDRPLSARARKNSTATSVASVKDQDAPAGRRPSSSHSVQQAASSNAIAELEQAAGAVRDNASTKGASTPKEPTDAHPSFETSNMKLEDLGHAEPESMDIDVPAPAPASARPGRTSKTATPVAGAFPEIPMARSRSSRNANNGNTNSNTSSENNSTTGTASKRGHKKNAQQNTTAASPAMKPTPNVKSNPPSSAASSVAQEQDYQEAEAEAEPEVESEEDGDEPRYCYCNEVSYGNMIACDNDDCPREWFHLGCVHLDKPPTGRAKWFCSDECKDTHAKAKAKGGRPGSSRQ
ncbi:PHD finger domain containing protein [Stemphylium lycopersici]|uniref:PHD finger domain containing protein n=1 Tax=Stemphylium lycopersici TaxID=183478 RepID=A0A364MW89_STELY|nr:PHD finger domain containing protein [Stemphylium lycopersici]